MSNPTFTQGPITAQVGEKIDQYRLVTLNEDSKVKHAGADGLILGAVTERRDPTDPRSTGTVAVHYGVAAVKLTLSDDKAEVKPGAKIFAAADGKVATTGTVAVGVAIQESRGGRVLTILNRLPHAA